MAVQCRAMIINSPGKPLVPGRPMPTNPNSRKKPESSGMLCITPPSRVMSVETVQRCRKDRTRKPPPAETLKLSNSSSVPCSAETENEARPNSSGTPPASLERTRRALRQ